MSIGWLILGGYLVLTLLCAALIYTSWRRRLQIHDPLGALLLGVGWPLMFPIMIIDRIEKRKLPTKKLPTKLPTKLSKGRS
jgi:hypothetical protein